MKKYLPHTTCKKWISVDKNLAIPSIKGSSNHPDKFNTYANIPYLKAEGSHILHTKSPISLFELKVW